MSAPVRQQAVHHGDPGADALEGILSPSKPSLSLRSVVACHPQPFVVIDEDYRVVAVNEAFLDRQPFSGGDALGRPCYEVSRGHDRPCHELGEDCPRQRVYATGKACSCTHVRHGRGDTLGGPVRITLHLLETSDGRRLLGESLEYPPPPPGAGDAAGDPMVGRSPAFQEALGQLALAARSNFPVLLLGETGTGKELAAGELHRRSARGGGPLLTLDCTTLTDPLFESEVFGHERGAFTGSVGERAGLFELADGGTLFLDEVGELSPSAQAKLLRVLETGQYRRVGGQRVREADVRVVCATNRPLWELVAQGTFRADLYHRIACLTVTLPPLRQRREDIPELARRFALELATADGTPLRFTDEALALMAAQDYPGNIRQLRNLVYAAASRCTNPVDGPCLGQALALHQPQPGQVSAPPGGAGSESLEDREKQCIQDVLAACGGNREAAARRLGISTRTLYRRLRRYGPH